MNENILKDVATKIEAVRFERNMKALLEKRDDLLITAKELLDELLSRIENRKGGK